MLIIFILYVFSFHKQEKSDKENLVFRKLGIDLLRKRRGSMPKRKLVFEVSQYPTQFSISAKYYSHSREGV